MGWGKKFKKAVGKTINKVTGGNTIANKVLGYALAFPTGGASLNTTSQATKMQVAHEERKEAQAAAAAEEAAQTEAANRYKASILGQRQQRIEDALSSQTDYTGDEEADPRDLITRPDVSKKKRLIGF